MGTAPGAVIQRCGSSLGYRIKTTTLNSAGTGIPAFRRGREKEQELKASPGFIQPI